MVMLDPDAVFGRESLKALFCLNGVRGSGRPLEVKVPKVRCVVDKDYGRGVPSLVRAPDTCATRPGVGEVSGRPRRIHQAL